MLLLKIKQKYTEDQTLKSIAHNNSDIFTFKEYGGEAPVLDSPVDRT